MGKIILFYKYIRLDNPDAIRAWQKDVCSRLGLTGRVLIAHEGINGTLGGPEDAINAYIAEMRACSLFADIDFKEGDGSHEHFPRLQVLNRPHILNLGVSADEAPLSYGGQHLTPQEAHEFIDTLDDGSIVFDTRNTFEWRIGKFMHAYTPEIDHFRDLPAYIDTHPELFKDKDVLMYCTGGVRCERATALLRQKGLARNVYQINGGIHRYVEQYPNGYFRGKNYVFDGRIGVRITDDVLTNCDLCGTACDIYTNCINAPCNKHIISCEPCRAAYANTCSSACYNTIMQHQEQQRSIIRAWE